MKHFWVFRDRSGKGAAPANGEFPERELIIDGEIADETWGCDDITPATFRGELFAGSGHVTVWINSPGGDCIAASQIYTMLMEYRRQSLQNRVTVKIDGMAASAASVIAMSGYPVLMSPTAMMMIHNPSTIAIGDHNEMEKAADILNEVRESIINAYERKTGLSRTRLAHMMEAESWMNANRALELGFCDGILGNGEASLATETAQDGTYWPEDAARTSYCYERKTADAAILNRLAGVNGQDKHTNMPSGRRVDELMDRLMTR